MKKTFLNSLAAVALMLAACDKNDITSRDLVDATAQAQFRVANFSMYKANPQFQIKVNDARVSHNIAAATPFPGSGLNTLGPTASADYFAMTPGNNQVSISFVKIGTGTDSLPGSIAAAPVTVEAGKKYTLYFTDTAANTTPLLVLDTLNRPDSGFAKYKFVNIMPDMPALDLYFNTTKVASNIPYKGVSPSFTIPTTTPATFTWGIRAVGGATNLISYAGTAASLGNQRVFTVVARGYNGVTTTTDVRSRKVSLIYNQ
jgi:hypothetical protein